MYFWPKIDTFPMDPGLKTYTFLKFCYISQIGTQMRVLA
ncbi:hypothetical protein SAMN05216463_1318 [Xylanibacter ruminicola]|uniref:Uncharacterized protein n=1 Tax=Xylanibacter ruminicola TaxID=839 RepID=A0A1M6YQF1_XYLRU|nr:hypothetical protein SAMN05216463_1318 [Xylanibacter ruminicola]